MSLARVRNVKGAGLHRRRERRRLLVATGGALSLAIASALSIANFTGVDVAAAAVSEAQSFLELMHRRSPGARTEAQLTKTKHRHHRVLAERSLPELPEIPAVAPVTPTVALFAPPLQAALPVFPEAPLLTAAAYPPPLFFVPPIGGVFAPPPGGSGGPPGGPGGPGGPPQQPPPEQPPAVPEPSTWAMMILGFGLSGWALRRGGRGGPALVRRSRD
jgi:hypothetical protein